MNCSVIAVYISGIFHSQGTLKFTIMQILGMAAKYESYLVVGFSHHIVKVCSIPQKEHNASNFRVTECDSGRCSSKRKVGTV